MKYVRIIGGEPKVVTKLDLRQDPIISFPYNLNEAALAEHDIYPLVETAAPTGDDTEEAAEDTPELVNGEWRQRWLLRKRPVPGRVSKGAFVRVIRSLPAGVRNQFRSYVTGLSAEDREDLDNALWISRDGDFIANVQTAMGVTDEQMNNLFRRAGRLRDEV